jgi:hypothetical protein
MPMPSAWVESINVNYANRPILELLFGDRVALYANENAIRYCQREFNESLRNTALMHTADRMR